MTASLLPFLYSEVAYSIIFNITFGAFFVRKVMKLDKLGDNLDVKIPRRDWAKFSIILMIIFLLVLHLVLAYSSSNYWLSEYPNFSLVIFFYIVNYTMQGYIVLKLLTKGLGQRYIPNFLFWTFCMAASIIQVIIISVIVQLCQKLSSNSQFSATIQLIQAILNFGLIGLSLFFDKALPERDILKSLRSDSDTGRTIQDSIHRQYRNPAANRLFIEFSQHFDISQEKEGLICIFKLAVYVDDKHTIISKTDLDFIKLGLELKKIFPSKSEVVPPQLVQKHKNMLTYGEERLKAYENYILDLIKTGEFIIPALLDFLEIPANLRAQISNNDFYSIRRQETGDTIDEEKCKKPFFLVYAEDHKIMLENKDFLSLNISRPINEIIQFYNRLKEEKRLTIDILPENPQQQDLVSFFSIVVNKKSLWRSFASWHRLDIQLQNKIYNYFDPWVMGFKNIGIDIIGHEIVFDSTGKIHTCYLISLNGNINKNSSEIEPNPRGITLKKRYSEFCTLDKHVRRFMSNREMNKDQLQPLPPKFSPFGSKTSPKSRQMRFGIYMKTLIRIEGINQCIKLLEFLEFDSINTVQEMEQDHQQHAEVSELSYFSDLNERC